MSESKAGPSGDAGRVDVDQELDQQAGVEGRRSLATDEMVATAVDAAADVEPDDVQGTDGDAAGNTYDGDADGNTDDGDADGNTDDGDADGNTDGDADVDDDLDESGAHHGGATGASYLGARAGAETSGEDDRADNPSPDADDGGERSGVGRLEREGDIAADYLEELLDIADIDGDIDLDVENDRAMVSIVGTGLGNLVGQRGATLDALQDLTRLAVLRATGERSRLMLDIAGTRARRKEQLHQVGTEAAGRARSDGEPVRLDPMTPFERKVVHDAVAAAGLRSESDGVEPNRRVVVYPG